MKRFLVTKKSNVAIKKNITTMFLKKEENTLKSLMDGLITKVEEYP